MKKILLLLAIVAAFSCKKTKEDPKPSSSGTYNVTIGIKPNGTVNGCTVHIKALHPFMAYGIQSVNTPDSCYMNRYIANQGEAVGARFEQGDHIYISTVDNPGKLMIDRPGKPQFSYTYTDLIHYDFIID